MRDTDTMVTAAHAASGLRKASWRDADYPPMGWHGYVVHAISIDGYEQPDEIDFDDVDDTVPTDCLVLDLDCIVGRIEPEPPALQFTYWIAPGTLVFNLAYSIAIVRDPGAVAWPVVHLNLLEPRVGPSDPLWQLKGKGLDIQVRSWSFELHIRRPPQLVPHQFLSTKQRGGVSFEQRSYTL